MPSAVTQSDLITVYTIAEPNNDRILEDPLQLPVEPNDGMEQTALKDGNRYLAKLLDPYTDLKVCAIKRSGQQYYFMYCDDPAVKQFEAKFKSELQDDVLIKVFDYEVDMLAAFFVVLDGASVQYSYDGKTFRAFPGYIAGWKLQSEVWPMMVNKAFHYGIPIPPALRSDPSRRYSTIERLYDLANIYLQGSNPLARKLPPLADALKYWVRERNDKYEPPYRILNTLCKDPKLAASMIQPYLIGMETTAVRYQQQ